GEEAEEEEDAEEEEEEEEAEDEGEVRRDARGNYRVENYLRSPYKPTNEVPWISEEFQPYGCNLPQEENTSNETLPMSPSFTQAPQQPSHDNSPVREVRTVEEVEREITEQRLLTPTPDQSTPTGQGRTRVLGGLWRTFIPDSENEWEGELQRRRR